MRARCSKCQDVRSWAGYRGSRLEDLRSSCCNAPLEGMTKGQPRPRQKSIACPVCSRRRFPGTTTLKTLAQSQTYARPKDPTQVANWRAIPVADCEFFRLPAGTLVCWHHESLEKLAADFRRHIAAGDLVQPDLARAHLLELETAIASVPEN